MKDKNYVKTGVKISESLNIRQEETLPVLLFVLQSFFLGTFLGTFDVAANTLFLASFDSAMISKSYTISGLFGILFTSIYSSFQNRISFHRLALFSFATVFVVTFLLRFGYYVSDTKWLAFGLFILMGPLNIIALLGFWGSAGRIFDLRQGKRLFGLIDLGQIIGTIISSWAVPVLVANNFTTVNLMYISAVSAFIAFILQIVINSKFKPILAVKPEKKTADQKEASKNGFFAILKIPYVRIMALFVVCSTFVGFFVQYLFLAVAGSRFTESMELAKFLGALMGTLTFISVLIKSLVYGPLMKNYGLKISLLLSPIIVGFVIIAAAIVGSLFGYSIESAAFTFFFLLIALGKIFQTSLKSSVESPSLKMLYQSLPPSIRYEVQARVDGTINEVSCVTSGLLLTAIGLLSFTSTMYYIYVLLAIIFAWAIITIKLYKGYRKTLEETLENSISKHILSDDEMSVFASLSSISAAKQLQVVEKSKPWELPDFISNNLNTSNANCMGDFLQVIRNYGLTQCTEKLEALTSQVSASLSIEINSTVDYLKNLTALSKDEEKIKTLIGSKDYNERVEAAKIIGASDSSNKNNLTFLLRDLVPAVKKQAIWASRGVNSREVLSFIIEFLNKNEYAALSHAALLGTGNEGLDMLTLALQRSNSTHRFKERIVRIIPSTGSKEAHNVLLNNLKLRSDLCLPIIDGLLKLNFKATEKETIALKKLIIEQAGICAWNLNAQHLCPPQSKYPFLKFKLEDEYNNSVLVLFNMLKLLYDKHSILAVQENLENGTSQSITFAVEMLDTFLDEDLKTYLIPLLEDSSLSNKIWTLEGFFPLKHYNQTELLTAIINRDNNLISKQTKIYALNAFKYTDSSEITQDLVAQLFNTDKYLRQISAQLIESINPNEFTRCKLRLPDRNRVELDRQLEQTRLTNKSVVERLNFMKETPPFNSNNKNIDFMLYNTSITAIERGCNLLEFDSFKAEPQLIFVESGNIEVSENGMNKTTFGKGSIINTGEYSSEEFKLTSTEKSLLHYMPVNRLSEELYDNDFLINDLGQYVTL